MRSGLAAHGGHRWNDGHRGATPARTPGHTVCFKNSSDDIRVNVREHGSKLRCHGATVSVQSLDQVDLREEGKESRQCMSNLARRVRLMPINTRHGRTARLQTLAGPSNGTVLQ